MQFNWASFGSGVSSILIIFVFLVFLYICYRRNKRANKKARRAELHELVMLATRNGPHRSTKSEPASVEYPSSIHSPPPKTVSNPMYTQQPYSFPGSFLPGGPIVATPVLFSSDGVQFSRVGFPGVNHTQFPPITYVRDECWSPRIREVRRSPSPPRQRCVSYSSRDSSARVEPESILRQPSLSRQPSARSRHGSTVSLAPDVQDRIPAPRGFRTGTECLHQEE